MGAIFGEDVALTRVGEDILASHVDHIVGMVKGIGCPFPETGEYPLR
jgi:hydrogenase expression/formation protein HypE